MTPLQLRNQITDAMARLRPHTLAFNDHCTRIVEDHQVGLQPEPDHRPSQSFTYITPFNQIRHKGGGLQLKKFRSRLFFEQGALLAAVRHRCSAKADFTGEAGRPCGNEQKAMERSAKGEVHRRLAILSRDQPGRVPWQPSGDGAGVNQIRGAAGRLLICDMCKHETPGARKSSEQRQEACHSDNCRQPLPSKTPAAMSCGGLCAGGRGRFRTADICFVRAALYP